jgi:hypothetical protein
MRLRDARGVADALLPLLGNIRNATSAKAERVLGWNSAAR